MRCVVRQTFALGLAVVCATASAPERARAQQPAGAASGTVVGRVVDRASRQPVGQAQVAVVGTSLGARTNENGVYRVTGVAPGVRSLRVLRIGYEPATDSVAVTAGGVATLDFTVAVAAARLEQVVVTATGESLRRRETGNVVDVIATDSVNKTATADLTDVIAARAPGVMVQQTSGTAAGGSRIRIRGSNSISLSNEPLIIVDGVRTNNDQISTTIDIGGQNPSRLDDLNAEDIENIEVIKGPAGVALYGTAAANGVIQITTKRGRAGRTQWTAYAEGGANEKATTFPANFAQVGALPDGTRITGCSLDFQSQGACTPVADSLVSFNPLEQVSPFRTGARTSFGLSASGGGNATTYYVSGDVDRVEGIYLNDDIRRVNLRANLSTQLSPKVDLAVATGYVQSRAQLPQNDNNDLGALGNGLLGRAFDTPGTRGYLFYEPRVFRDITTNQDVDRLTTSVTGNWRPLDWLTGTGVLGLDYLSRADQSTIPGNLIPPPDQRFLGQRTSNPYRVWTVTANGNGTAVRPLGENLRSTTSAGVQFNRELTRGTQAFGRGLAAGTGSLAGATSGFAVFEQNPEIVTLGAYAQEQLAWHDRLFGSVALRGDDNSAFGQDFKLALYPSASLSWVMSDEPFFPSWLPFSTVRLRGAVGQSGQRPGFRNAQTFYNVVAVRQSETDLAAAAIGDTVGNNELKPERTTEYEGGLDLGMLQNRLNLELTYYNKTTKDALILRLLPPSVGALSRFENLGNMTNKGVEGSLTATLVDRSKVRWDLGVNGSYNANKLVTLGQGVDTIFFGLGASDGNFIQRFVEGLPAGGYWQRPFLGYSDASHDGIIERDEVQLGDHPVYLGSPIPKTMVSFSSSVTLFSWLRVSGLLDHRGGNKLYNATGQFRCSQIVRCQAAFDPRTPLAEQARVISSVLGSDAPWVEDASFWKLRELAFTLIAPRSLAGRFGTQALSLTIAGRNLKTWTDYTGFDPEVNSEGTTNYSTDEFLTQPATRLWSARVTVNW
jgi:TonB-dependent starch-binding outer membrane protein SusC